MKNLLKIATCAVAMFFVLLSSGCACTIINEVKRPEAEKIAREQFGLDEIWITESGGNPEYLGIYFHDRYFWYVVGRRAEEEVMVVIQGVRRGAFETDWVFVKSFPEIMAQLAEKIGKPVEQIEMMDVSFLVHENEIKEFIPEINIEELDVLFAIEYFRGYVIVQIDGEIVIYDVTSQPPQVLS